MPILTSKGINHKQKQMTRQRFLAALESDENQVFHNKGFRVKDNQIVTYVMMKSDMKLFNDKRLRIWYETLPPTI